MSGLLFLASLASVLAAQDEDRAGQILAGTKVRTGLCLHLGCGTAAGHALTAELTARSRMLVHGLALDQTHLARARAAIDARNMHGRAMAELAPPAPLPYYDNLANLVLVEDEAALKAVGIEETELLRVLAPGGALLRCRNGTWESTVKPRPKNMDSWTHPNHGPDGNLVSADSALTFPLSLRWLDGVPVCVNSVAGTRAWVLNSRLLFTYGINEVENLAAKGRSELYLSARDAYNGLPLWKVPCGGAYDGTGILWENAGPLCCDEDRVYVSKDGKLAIFEAATGKLVAEAATTHAPSKLLVINGMVVAACWTEEKQKQGAGTSFMLVPKAGKGSVEAFDAATGAPKWKFDRPAARMVAADSSVYLLVLDGNPVTARRIVALDLANGTERWSKEPKDLGGEGDVQLLHAAPDSVVVWLPREKIAVLLAQADGAVRWRGESQEWAPVVDGQLWIGGAVIDPRTGETKGKTSARAGRHHCSPSKLAGSYLLSGHSAIALNETPAKRYTYPSVRAACVEGVIPANGLLYNAQNNCKCYPAAVYGFLAFGANGIPSGSELFAAPRPVERGPAFNADLTGEPAVPEWPCFRGNAERTASTHAPGPRALERKWQTRIPLPAPEATGLAKELNPPDAGSIGSPNDCTDAWQARLSGPLTAPVVAGGMVFVAATDAGRLHALDLETGAARWSVSFGARIDSPPALHRGMCVLGCHDGWVYALRAADGALAWRARIAPVEKRRVAYGLVESPWPAPGAVLIRNGIVYACAGRSSETDGGVVLAAFKLDTGATVWSRALNEDALRLNDVLAWRDGSLAWHAWRFDPASGQTLAPTEGEQLSKFKGGGARLLGAMLDGTWTRIRNRRAGNAYLLGEKAIDAMAWNQTLAVTCDGGWSPDGKAQSWKTGYNARNRFVEALALSADAAVLAGRQRPKVDAPLVPFVALWNLADGKLLAEAALPADPVHEGLALAGGRLIVCLHDGTVMALGK